MAEEERDIQGEVRNFLKGIPWKKILTFSFFVVIAAILWFMQVYNRSFETNIRIPVKYTSLPDSVIFNDTLPDHLNVRVKDYGYAMFRYGFSKGDSIHIDISSVLQHSSSATLQGSVLEAYISRSLPQSASVVRFDPVRISLAHSLLKSRKVPVVFDGQVNLSPGYFLNGDIRISPDSVMVYGSLADLTKLTYIYTTNDTLNGLDTNRKVSYDLIKDKNLKTNPDKVSVYIPVEAYQQMRINIPVECFNLPDNLNVKFFPSNVTMSFYIGVSMADSVRLDDFSVGIDYEGLKDSKQVSVPVRVTSTSPYARNLTLDPPNVEYIFEYK